VPFPSRESAGGTTSEDGIRLSSAHVLFATFPTTVPDAEEISVVEFHQLLPVLMMPASVARFARNFRYCLNVLRVSRRLFDKSEDSCSQNGQLVEQRAVAVVACLALAV